jgi:hypothetical protein
MSVARESRLLVGAAVFETREGETMQDYADSLVLPYATVRTTWPCIARCSGRQPQREPRAAT